MEKDVFKSVNMKIRSPDWKKKQEHHNVLHNDLLCFIQQDIGTILLAFTKLND